MEPKSIQYYRNQFKRCRRLADQTHDQVLSRRLSDLAEFYAERAKAMEPADQRGPNVLIVEDELIIADAMEGMLIESGYKVCGIACTVREAVALARQYEPDLAVIDLRLAEGGVGTEVAAQLVGSVALRVLYASSNLSQFKLNALDGAASLEKPHSYTDLVRSLEIVMEIGVSGTTTRSFPYGFRLLGEAPAA